MKTLITLFTAVLLSQAITAQTTLIPDANFEGALINLGYDTGTPDGSVPTANISGVTNLYIAYKFISDLTGIEDFAALDTLQCQLNQLTSLNVSQNTALTHLRCYQNQLTSLDVSQNTALTWLSCDGNQLTSLDVSNNTALEVLGCGADQLTSLDVSNNTALTELWCAYSALTSLDVSQNTALEGLYCYGNQLTSLDLSNNTALTQLNCDSNQLNCLNVKNGNNDYIVTFRAQNNPNLTCIEVDDTAWSTANWTVANESIDATASFSNNCNNPCSSATTGIAEYGLSFKLYPNPVTSYLVVETRYPLQLAIYNVQGKLILDKAISSTYTMDLSELARGIYFLTATDEQGRVYSQKVVKE